LDGRGLKPLNRCTHEFNDRRDVDASRLLQIGDSGREQRGS
jgi:hypothetical protein